MDFSIRRIKTALFELQNLIFRKLVAIQFLSKNKSRMLFLGNQYSGYWFPRNLVESAGTIWGVGLGHDSSFELALVKLKFQFVGFEPELTCFTNSVKQFAGTSAKIENYGLWDKPGTFSYTGENISIVDIFKLGNYSEEKLEIKSLWDVASEKDLNSTPRPRVLKMNIEGAEKEILLKFIAEPLPFDVIIFQAEFLFHVGFMRFKEKWQAYKDLKLILIGMTALGWVVTDISRHQFTLSSLNVDSSSIA